jgi:hypothetical protein
MDWGHGPSVSMLKHRPRVQSPILPKNKERKKKKKKDKPERSITN